ncbi:uncharacterized protein LOC142333639 [Lycorma delicatula]|uniref:uncharacterized protein LOC142333639 n=1 Tax=Lycorma delicatula TaxID=130591 RepID=UPI003F5151F9
MNLPALALLIFMLSLNRKHDPAIDKDFQQIEREAVHELSSYLPSLLVNISNVDLKEISHLFYGIINNVKNKTLENRGIKNNTIKEEITSDSPYITAESLLDRFFLNQTTTKLRNRNISNDSKSNISLPESDLDEIKGRNADFKKIHIPDVLKSNIGERKNKTDDEFSSNKTENADIKLLNRQMFGIYCLSKFSHIPSLRRMFIEICDDDDDNNVNNDDDDDDGTFTKTGIKDSTSFSDLETATEPYDGDYTLEPFNTTYYPFKPTRYHPVKTTRYYPFKPTRYYPFKPTRYHPVKSTRHYPFKPTRHYPFKTTRHYPFKTTRYYPFKTTRHYPFKTTRYYPFKTTRHYPFKTTRYHPFETTRHYPFKTTRYHPFETTTYRPFKTTSREYTDADFTLKPSDNFPYTEKPEDDLFPEEPETNSTERVKFKYGYLNVIFNPSLYIGYPDKMYDDVRLEQKPNKLNHVV